jgi:hypothetical protein
MELIAGAELLQHPVFGDNGAELIAFEQFPNSPFPWERVFFMTFGPGSVRGGHANSCHELLIAVCGAISVEVDNGINSAEVCLDRRDKSLWVKPGVLVRLRSLVPGTIVLALASASYSETRHYDRPQPHLITMRTAT